MTKKNNKSAVARRREQVQRQQEQQNRFITIGASVLAVVVLAIIGYLIFVNLRDRNAANDAASAGSGSGTATEMVTDRPLADLPPAERVNYYDAYPEYVIDPQKDYEALIETSQGDIRLDLFVPLATQTVNNFVFLANQGYYDGVVFHRVLDDFMAQTGDPSGTGRGGPGYQFSDELDSGLQFDRRGLLAMANAGPNTNGSQFFITFVPTPHLNGGHTIFGEVIEGDAVLDQLTRVDPTQPDQPEPDVIERITIFEIDPS